MRNNLGRALSPLLLLSSATTECRSQSAPHFPWATHLSARSLTLHSRSRVRGSDWLSLGPPPFSSSGLPELGRNWTDSVEK